MRRCIYDKDIPLNQYLGCNLNGINKMAYKHTKNRNWLSGKSNKELEE